MAASMDNSTITNTTFQYNVEQFDIQNATIDRCNFNGEIIKASVTGELTKCKFEKLYDDIAIKGTLVDMTVQDDISPSSAAYVQDGVYPSKLTGIATLKIDSTVVPRLAEVTHKECYINTIDPGSRVAFIVQLSSDDTNPSGVILMWAGSTSDIPKGYAICDGNNGTPNLTGKFIRAIDSNEEVGDKPNEDLIQQEDGEGRFNSIKIVWDNLPYHEHYIEIDEMEISHTLQVSYETLRDTITVVNNTSSGNGKYGEEGTDFSYTEVSTSSSSIDFSHNHTLNGDITVDSVTFKEETDEQKEERFPNTPINIEPNAYALIFIMKL